MTGMELIIAALVLAGAFFLVVGAVGLARFPDFYTRLHGPTKATTLGIGSLLVASTLYFWWMGEGFRVTKLLVALFLFLTAPVSAHQLAKSGLRMRLPGATPGQ